MAERFWSKVDRRGPEECWPWLAYLNSQGYGRFMVRDPERANGKRMAVASRVAYELAVGPIPDGLELDHLCRNPACVNPNHLEPVTHAENVRRSTAPGSAQRKRTHCPQGHPYSGRDNTGGRICHPCRAEQQRNYLRKRRAA